MKRLMAIGLACELWAYGAQAAPNLTPFKPNGWSNKIVVSTTSGAQTDSLLTTSNILWVSFAVVNNGSSAAIPFATDLYLDGALQKTWYYDANLNVGWYINVTGYPLGFLTEGTHTLSIRADSGNAVAESSESDNEFSRTLQVLQAPSITSQPQSLRLNSGKSVTLQVVATGTAPLRYQWYQGTSGKTDYFLAFATNASFNTGTLFDSSSFWVRVSNDAGSVDSDTAILTVTAPPAITYQSVGATVGLGQKVFLEASASGTPPLVYQWTKDGTNVAEDEHISGATTQRLSIGSFRRSDAGAYRLSVANDYGTAQSSNAVLMVGSPPVFTLDPTNILAKLGVTVTFTASVNSAEAVGFLWRKDENDLLWTNGSSLVLENAQPDAAGVYTVLATNRFGSTLSAPATLSFTSADLVYSSARDTAGNVYVVGRTCTPGFPVTAGAFRTNRLGGFDAFVAKFGPGLTNLLACTLLGGAGDDEAHSVAVDNAGNVWVAGDTKSSSFQPTAGAYLPAGPLGLRDVFVAKLRGDLSMLLAATRFGGDNYDANFAIAAAPQGGVYVAGQTDSLNFPVTSGAFASTNSGLGEAFIAKFSQDLSRLEGATFLGGAAEDLIYCLSLDQQGHVWAAGETRSADFPTTPGAFCRSPGRNWDAFVTKFDPELSRVQASTLLAYDDNDCIYAMALNQDGTVLLAGETGSTNFPTTPGAFSRERQGEFDAFVLRLDGSLTNLIASTLLGGNDYDTAYALALAPDGSILVAGDTYSTNFPSRNPDSAGAGKDSCDIFAARFDPLLAQLESGMVTGGSSDEYLYSIIPGANGSFVLVGDSYSRDFGSASFWRGSPDLFLAPGLFAAPTPELVLQILRDPAAGFTLRWASTPQSAYFIERSPDLGGRPMFTLIRSNILGSPGFTTFRDTNAGERGPWFYRLGRTQ